VAADVARRVATAVAAADRELGALARDASVAEVDRLTARLTALEDASAHDADGDVRELHDLVRRQLDVLHRMRRHHDAVCHRRTRLLDGARGIWTQLYAVRDAAAGPAEACAPAITRLRALCDETAALIAAAAPAPPSRG
jgi:hypothetical protein